MSFRQFENSIYTFSRVQVLFAAEVVSARVPVRLPYALAGVLVGEGRAIAGMREVVFVCHVDDWPILDSVTWTCVCLHSETMLFEN